MVCVLVAIDGRAVPWLLGLGSMHGLAMATMPSKLARAPANPLIDQATKKQS